MNAFSPVWALIFLVFALASTAFETSLMKLGKFKAKEILKVSLPHLFSQFLQMMEWSCLHCLASLSKTLFFLLFAAAGSVYLLSHVPFPLAIVSVILLSWILDGLVQILTQLWPKKALRASSPFVCISSLPFYPVVGLAGKWAFKKTPAAELDRTKLRQWIQTSELQSYLDPLDQKLVASFLNFKELSAKEIMVPRVDIFSLEAATSLDEASKLFAKEGYSRIPIYKDSLDHIVGVVLYKDLLRCFVLEDDMDLNAGLETIAKPVIYAPENKKIAHLLQEFRLKQIHMAIIVDEYGGTEGIVTIEDILEELVGEIEDEYDIGDRQLFIELPGGGWIVDAKMTIHDIKEQLGIPIPSHPEYETIGGYIYHCAGTIPHKGWRLSHDDFDLEVVHSTERSIKKIKITPQSKKI